MSINNSADNTNGLQIGGLSQLLAAAKDNPLPPLEKWNPPYCGDIGLKIDRDGAWYYRDSLIERKSLVKLFARVLLREGDGRYFLVTPVEKVDVHVEDVPFLAVELDVAQGENGQVLSFRTNLDDIVQCDGAHPLSFQSVPPHGGLKPYIEVRRGLKARVTRALLYDIVDLAETEAHEGREVLGVRSGGSFFELPQA